MDISETNDDLTECIKEKENSMPMTLENIPIKSLAPNSQDVNELNQQIILNYQWNGNNIPCSFNYVSDMENLITLEQNLNQLPDFQGSEEAVITDDQDQSCYKVLNGTDLPSEETNDSSELLQNEVDVSDKNSTIVDELPCDKVFKDEENKILVSQMENDIYGVFNPDELPTEPTVVFAQNKNGEIIQLIGSYSAQANDIALISEGNNEAPEVIHNTTMPNSVNASVEDSRPPSHEQTEDSEMLYYSEDGQILFCSAENTAASDNEIAPPAEINSANGDGIVTVLNSTEPDCGMLIESVAADNQYPNQNHLIIYSTDSTQNEVFNSAVAPQNANIISVLDTDNFSANSTKLALLDEEGNIVGLLCDKDQSEPEKIVSTLEDKSFDASSCDISTMPNVSPERIIKHKPEIRCRIVKPSKKTSRGPKKQCKPIKNREPKPKTKPLELSTSLPAKASWSVGLPSEYENSSEILVLHPLQTRKITPRVPQGLPVPASSKSGCESTLEHFDRDLVTVPMINENKQSNGIKVRNRRKQKFSLIKDPSYNLFCTSHMTETTTTNKTYLDRYADTEIPEINEIFARKKRAVALAGNNGSTSGSEVPNSSAVNDSSLVLFTNSLDKERSIAKQPESSSESGSSDEHEQVGKSLKCEKCGKIFKSSRSVSIHRRLCKQLLESCPSPILDNVASEVAAKEVKKVEANINDNVKISSKTKNTSGSSLPLKRKCITRSHTKLLENKKRK